MAQCKSTAEEVSFEWSHQRILLIDSKVRTELHVFIIDSESKRPVNPLSPNSDYYQFSPCNING